MARMQVIFCAPSSRFREEGRCLRAESFRLLSSADLRGLVPNTALGGEIVGKIERSAGPFIYG